MTRKFSHSLFAGTLITLLASVPLVTAIGANLSLGADYRMRWVSTTEYDQSIRSMDYYSQRLEGYMTVDLSKDVEASVRIQSLSPWGVENSSEPMRTRYPNANGSPWVHHAYLRLPNLMARNLILTVGRQPLLWGDGAILSDDNMGMNAIRVQGKSPLTWLPVDGEAFTAKITETLRDNDDRDLYGALIGTTRDFFRWEFMGLWDKGRGAAPYRMDGSTYAFSAGSFEREIYGARVRTNIRDAFLRGEYYIQRGNVRSAETGEANKTLGGVGYVLGVGGKADVGTYGLFGATLNLIVGDGDDPGTPDKDEAFRPGFTSRWDGLERRGYGSYFAANFNDVYNPNDPFGAVDTVNNGLPEGTSGLQIIHFGMESTPWAAWTFTADYYTFKAQKSLAATKQLGTELDFGVAYRHSGLVTFRATLANFKAKDGLYPIEEGVADPTRNKQDARRITAEVEIKF